MSEWRPLAGGLAAQTTGAGPRVVFLHGFTQTGNSWKPLAARLAAQGHECVVVDLPGHGGSELVRADLRRTADLVGAIGGRAAYVGYSLGGRACLHLAIAYPHLVTHLALIGADPGIDDDDERARRREADDVLAARVQEIGVEAFVRAWVTQPLFGELELSDADLADRFRNTAEGLASSLRLAGTGAQGSLWPRLHELNMPLVAIAGAHDSKFSAIAQQIAAATPRGEACLVPAASHAAHLQQPARVLRAIDELLAR